MATLWWWMLGGGTVIFVGVLLAYVYALYGGRRRHRVSERAFLVGGGLAFPVVTLLALLVYAVLVGDRIAGHGGDRPLRVEAHPFQWGWEFRYPEAPGGTLRSTGVLHVPAGRPFEVRVTSPDVIHSFWVPRLGGKVDAIPGHVNTVRLQADVPGDYGGQCAEYCGVGHVHMPFTLRAHPEAEYEAALAALPVAPAAREPAPGPRPGTQSSRVATAR